MNRGCCHAGAIHASPMSSRRKNRRPKANGIRPAFSATASTFAGTSRSMALLGNGSARQDFGDDLIGCNAFEVRLRLEQHAMAQNRRRGGLYVVGNQEVSALDRSDGFGYQQHRDGRAGAGSQTYGGRVSRRADDRDDVTEQLWLHSDAPGFIPYCCERLFGNGLDLHAVKASRIKPVLVARQYL